MTLRALPLIALALTLGCKDDEMPHSESEAPGDSAPDVDADGDGFTASEDCDDDDPAVNPDADEVCDGIDNNCDDLVDDESATDQTTFYADTDGDGWGSADDTVLACSAPDGYAAQEGDCDPDDAEISPDAREVCEDGIDNDCSGADDLCNTNPENADFIFLGETEGDRAGICVGSIGDVDGDGLADFAIGASEKTNGEYTNGGAVYVYTNTPEVGTYSLADADFTFYGDQEQLQIGRAIDGADFNADGIDDLVVSAHRDSELLNLGGSAKIYFGPLTEGMGFADADVTLTGEAASDRAGTHLAAAGDVNGDGNDDLIIGAIYSSESESNAGGAFLVLGPITSDAFLVDADARFRGESENDEAGVRVRRAGDTDGDGLSDLLISSRKHNSSTGMVYLITDNPSGQYDLADATARLSGEAEGNQTGSAIKTAGDVNGDGYDDFLVGSVRSTNGTAYLVLGPVSGDQVISDVSYLIIQGDGEGDQLGPSVDASDIDGDGSPSILVTANRAQEDDAGAVYLFRSVPTGTVNAGDADSIYIGAEAGDYLGSWATFTGDIRGTGGDSVLVGASRTDTTGTDAGTAYLFQDIGI